MTPHTFPRRLAAVLLQSAISIAPRESVDWGHAMLGELHQVEGKWSALLWSLGGAGVLAKHALVALIFPKANRSILPSGGDLFSKESPVRKTVLTITAVCLAASLLFFLAPVFRQAFQVSLAQWHDVLHVNQRWSGSGPDLELEALARKAEQNHDAEALAFVAVRLTSQSENTKLAEEAVKLDSNLTWVYAVVAVQCPWRPEIDPWIPVLKQWDPQNALPYLIDAERIDVGQVVREGVRRGTEDEFAAWQSAMATAFQSQKLDNYFSRFVGLNRRVLLRYHVDDPFQTLGDEGFGSLPNYDVSDVSRYAKLLLESGHTLEAQNDRRDASEKYLAVARFGQMMGPTGALFLQRELQDAYQRLGAISLKDGNKEQSVFYDSLADQTDTAHHEALNSLRNQVHGGNVSRWNATLVKASGLALLFLGGLLLTCALGVIARCKSIRLSELRPSSLTLSVGLCAGIGALLSSAVLYVSYRPYAEIFRRFIITGDQANLAELSSFLRTAQFPLGGRNFLDGWNFVLYFWSVVTLLSVIALLLAVVRHFQTRPRPAAAA